MSIDDCKVRATFPKKPVHVLVEKDTVDGLSKAVVELTNKRKHAEILLEMCKRALEVLGRENLRHQRLSQSQQDRYNLQVELKKTIDLVENSW